MKRQRYIVEIEMPDGDFISAGWLKDLIQTDCDVEDEGGEKITVQVQGTSIPSNLDEAAEEYCKDKMNYDDSLIFHRQYLAEIFKAGAEWQLNEDSKKHYFAQLKNIKDSWQELKKINPEIKSKPALCFYKGAEWMAGQVMMLKWRYPEEKYQYPECLTRIMDEYGDWHYTISEGHLNPNCEYISLAELSLRLATWY